MPDGYGVFYQPPFDFSTGATIEVKVDASDRASPPNSMETEVYEFTIVCAGEGKGGFPPEKKAEEMREEMP